MNSQGSTRYFTPTEANELLGELVSDMEEARNLLYRAQDLAEEDDDEDEEEIDQLKESIAEVLRGVEGHGVRVKGIDPFLLDFPALRNGLEVFLCWREGEQAVDWWHPIPTGIAGRQPLSNDDPGWWEWLN